jgi:rod shape determining protein RodA
MWESRYLQYIDWRIVFVIGALMIVSLLIISATDPAYAFATFSEVGFFTPKVIKQIENFFVGTSVFLLFAGFDYNKLREWAPFLYTVMILSLLGLFFTPAIQNVHRWYRIPVVGMSVQPSEYAKLFLVITLSWFLERNRRQSSDLKTAFLGSILAGIPFLLILKQPDLGTALVLCPITFVMFYLGNIHKGVLRCMMIGGIIALVFILLIFSKVLSYDEMRPVATKFLRPYQYERLDPDNHHQRSAVIAIGVGGWMGKGWRKSSFTGRGWLPFAYTDSVFAAFGEEFGFIGLIALLLLFYTLVYFGFQVTAVAKDHFGRMLSSGVTIYLAMHILVNVGMMCGFLPITGVPLILISYGGSSVCATMAALGIMQSIYSRRFMF